MARRKPKVDKVGLHITIPKELLEEADYYIENYSMFFTACLRNKIDSIRKKQFKNETAEVYHNTKNANKATYADSTCNNLVDMDEEYERLLAMYQEKRKNI